VRRTDLAQVVSRLLNGLAPSASIGAWRSARVAFTDLADTHLAYPAASIAVASGVMQAPDGAFQPSRAVTGAEVEQAIERVQALAARSGSSAAPR
jgi:hypothetical protein